MKSIPHRRAVIGEFARYIERYQEDPDIYGPALDWFLFSEVNHENVAELIALMPPDILAKFHSEADCSSHG